MLVDMHLHESTCSSDSKMTLEEIVATARERGLDAVCITDHDSMGLKETAEQYSRGDRFSNLCGSGIFFSLGRYYCIRHRPLPGQTDPGPGFRGPGQRGRRLLCGLPSLPK